MAEFSRFENDVLDLVRWLDEQTTEASSDDYGRDVAHAEMLMTGAECLRTRLSSVGQRRVDRCLETGQQLLQATRDDRVLRHVDVIKSRWRQLNDLANYRRETLSAALEIHEFNKLVEDLTLVIRTKLTQLTAVTVSLDNLGVARVYQHQHGIELASIKKQVEYVGEEADRLSRKFPNVQTHVAEALVDLESSWDELLDQAEARSAALSQAHLLQDYLQEHQQLMAWTKGMKSKISSAFSNQKTEQVKSLLLTQNEYQSEIDTYRASFSKLYEAGEQFIKQFQEHVLVPEVKAKNRILKNEEDSLIRVWNECRLH